MLAAINLKARVPRLEIGVLMFPGIADNDPVRYSTDNSFANHLHTEANAIMVRRGEEARKGDPPTERLDPDWRSRMEDVLWAVLNSSEFVFTP